MTAEAALAAALAENPDASHAVGGLSRTNTYWHALAAALLAALPPGWCGHEAEFANLPEGLFASYERQAAEIARLNAGEAHWHKRATLAEATIARLRAALDGLANPEGVYHLGGYYCPWCGTNVDVHGTTCPAFIARAALGPQADR
jgi:hypothetical protein